MLLTLIISVPAVILFFNWLGTIWRGADAPRRRRCCSRSGWCSSFGLGGLTGLFLADIAADLYLHDTFFVVGHFHLIMAAAVFLGVVRGHLLLVPEDVRADDERGARQAALLADASSRSTWCSAGSC